jgi:hypothetical protein
MTEYRTVKLAHPLSATYAEKVFAREAKDYQPGDEITVPTNELMRLVNAGLLEGIDPGDAKAVRELFLEKPSEKPQASTITAADDLSGPVAPPAPAKKK